MMMSYLKQFARNKQHKEKTEVLTARLPANLHSDFKSYCNELGISVSEAVYLLIDKEITNVRNDETTNMNTERIQKYTKENETTAPVVGQTTDVVITNTNVNTNRFTVKQWEVEGEIPCPICEEWVSKSNFSRHAKVNHQNATQVIFAKHEEKANAMLEERIHQTSR
jgi:antitoxin component of RelBE/YafQ-DinJ toxin-antitoxin module